MPAGRSWSSARAGFGSGTGGAGAETAGTGKGSLVELVMKVTRSLTAESASSPSARTVTVSPGFTPRSRSFTELRATATFAPFTSSILAV